MKSALPLCIAYEGMRVDVKAIPIRLRCPNGYVNIAYNKATAENFLQRRIDFLRHTNRAITQNKYPIYLA